MAAIHGGRLERPFGVNEPACGSSARTPTGWRSSTAATRRSWRGWSRRSREGADDARLAELARFAVREDRSWQALRWDNEQVVEAVARVLDEAAAHHALVAVDLGMLDGDLLAPWSGARSHLHVWVVPARPRRSRSPSGGCR